MLAALVAVNATAVTSFAIDDGMSVPKTVASIIESMTNSDSASNNSNSLQTDGNATPGTDISNNSDSNTKGDTESSTDTTKEDSNSQPGADTGASTPNPNPDAGEEVPSVPSTDSNKDNSSDNSGENSGESTDKGNTGDLPAPEEPDKPDVVPDEKTDPPIVVDPVTPTTPVEPTEPKPDTPSTPAVPETPEQPQEPEPPTVDVPDLPTTTVTTTEENEDIPDRPTQVEADENGDVPVDEHTLVDFNFPSKVGDTELHSISDEAFKGCQYFHSVSIPREITEIGKDAFADCEGLEYIILEGRTNTDDMTLGENWNGSAQIVYELVEVKKTVDVSVDNDTADKDPSENVDTSKGSTDLPDSSSENTDSNDEEDSSEKDNTENSNNSSTSDGISEDKSDNINGGRNDADTVVATDDASNDATSENNKVRVDDNSDVALPPEDEETLS